MAESLLSKINQMKHPVYMRDVEFWIKWRLTYSGGPDFVRSYLQKFSNRESDADFLARKSISYCPAYAKAALNDIKNAIFQRTCDVARYEGHETYQRAVEGLKGGVDMEGSSMDEFIGTKILSELLPMAKVGVYVDMPPLRGPTVADNYNLRPYLYTYRAEDILNWRYEFTDGCRELTMVLLREFAYKVDPVLGIPTSFNERLRYVYKENGKIWTQFYNCDDKEGSKEESPIIELNIPKIPFVLFELPESLLKDVADLQIALMNIASADLGYIGQASYAMYVEQYDPRLEAAYLKPSGDQSDESGAATTNVGKVKEVKIGVGQGRRYAMGLDAPQFIHPSPEPLKASMEKQAEMKKDIRLLVNLSVSNLNPVRAGVDSKMADDTSLESGLSFIGLVLEKGERQIAEHWANYLKGATPATVNYPKTYRIRSEDDRQKEIDGHEKIMSKIPSKTFQKEVAKVIAEAKLSGRVSKEVLDKIKEEISGAPAMVCDYQQVHQDWDDGLVSTKTASLLRGYDAEKEVPIAAKDRAQRIKLTMEAQGGAQGQARGAKDFQTTQPTSIDEKVDKQTRGAGKNNNE